MYTQRIRSSFYKSAVSITLGLVICMAVACSGGGGGDNDNNDVGDVSGVWRGNLALTKNDCNLNLTNPEAVVHTVNQNGSSVVLTDQDNVQHAGTISGQNDFTVETLLAAEQINGANCTITQRITYQGANAAQATIIVRDIRNCDGSPVVACESTLQGLVSRDDLPTPTPVPTANPTPSDGIACGEINERTYSGDAKCGLTSVTISKNGGALVLEPFGVNGATSFTPVATDNTQAASTRTDLTINGITGYNCALECLGPVTFSVNCFLEGGQSCSERF